MHVDRILERARELQQLGRGFALVTVTRAQAPTSAKPGDKAIVEPDGTITGWVGGGCAQPAVIVTVKEALRDGQPRHIRITPDIEDDRRVGDIMEFGMPCYSGGTLELFIDPVAAKPALVVVGASPVAQVLARVAPAVGFRCTVVTRKRDASVFADMEQVLDESEAAQAPRGAYVVVATQGKRDLESLRIALALDAVHVAFVASAKKAGVLRETLAATGSPAAAVAAIESPAGMSIGAVTPEEIALSVLARIVAVRRGRDPGATAATIARCAEAAPPAPLATAAPASAAL
jgi:xanthine dehydrogenase accessory factor